MRGTDREGAQPPRCPPGSVPPAPGDRIGVGKQQAGSPPSSIPAPGLFTGFAAGSMGCLSHLLVGDGSGSACSHLPAPPAADGWDLGVCICEDSVPCRAVPCHVPGRRAWFRSPAWSSLEPHPPRGMRGSAQPPAPSPHPSRCSILAAGQAQRGGPCGAGGQAVGEGMEPPSSRSRPLVSHMSRRCHTHLMWFLAGAAAALLRLIAARSSADR